VVGPQDPASREAAAGSTFGAGLPAWLGRLGHVRNVVRQEMISRQLGKHLPKHPVRVLDVGAGQGTQSIRLARAGHQVLAVEPDPAMRAVFQAALRAEPAGVQDLVVLRDGSIGDLAAVTALATAYGLQLEHWYGVRIAVDSDELDPPPPSDPRQLAALLDVEERLGATDPYRHLGQLAHLILRKANSQTLQLPGGAGVTGLGRRKPGIPNGGKSGRDGWAGEFAQDLCLAW